MAAARIRLSSIPPIGAAVAGAPVALAVALMPADWLTRVVEALALPELIPAAAPPLGVTARLLLASAGGIGLAAVAWAALFLLFGPGGVFAREGGRDGMPEVRSADAHPDAPLRRPLSADELGAPTPDAAAALPIVGPAAPIEQDVPRDLDQPLAAFDPRSIPDQPRPPVRAVAPLAKPRAAPLDPGERIESVDLSPRPGGDSIEALLSRLERGTRRRQQELRRAG